MRFPVSACLTCTVFAGTVFTSTVVASTVVAIVPSASAAPPVSVSRLEPRPSPLPPRERSRGKLYFTSELPDEQVNVVDLDGGPPSTIDLPKGSDVYWLDRTSDSKRLFVTSPWSQWVYAIDLATHAIVDQSYWGTSGHGVPHVVTVNPGDASITVTDLSGQCLSTLDSGHLATVLATDTSPTPQYPSVPAYRPGTLDLYVGSLVPIAAGYDTRMVSVRRPFIDWNSGTTIMTWDAFDIPHNSNTLYTDDGDLFEPDDETFGVGFLPEQRLVIVSNRAGFEVSIVDEDSHKTLATEWAPAYPNIPTPDPTSTASHGRFFLPSPDTDQLLVYDVTRADDGTVTLSVEAELFDVCLTPGSVVFANNDPEVAYLACSGEVLALDSKTLKVLKSLPIASMNWNPTQMVWAAR